MLKVASLEDQERRSSCRALLDGGATCILRPAVSEEEYAGGSVVQVETATEKVILRRVNKATVITNTQAQVILPLGQLVQRGFLVKWDPSVGLRRSTRVAMEVAEELISIQEIGDGGGDKMIGNAEWRKESTCPLTLTAVTGGDKSAGLEHGGGIKLKAFRVPMEGEKKEDPRPKSATGGPAPASEVVEGGGASR